MHLPLVNVFEIPYECWSWRDASREEMSALFKTHGRIITTVSDKLIATITSCTEAAFHVNDEWCGNAISTHISNALDASAAYACWRAQMPSRTPKALSDYQKRYPCYDKGKVDGDIKNIGKTLSEGQALFHGGVWPRDVNSFITSRPLSTSLCPQVAMQNAVHAGKAYKAGVIHLWVLRACNPKTNIFAFRKRGTNLGNEKEVLFASGAELRLCSRTLVCASYPLGNLNALNKCVEFYVLDVTIS